MTSLALSNDGSTYDVLEQLSQDFTSRIRKGEQPTIEEYEDAHPDLAESIRELFEAIVFAEQLNRRSKAELISPADQTLPAKLGPFELQREIGRGGMGIVYEATQTPFTQTFAIKVLKSRLISSKTLESRFEREAQAASKLHHPNIVPAKHYGTEADQNFLVMPMIDGVSLDKLINADESVDPKLFLLFDEICSDWRRIAELGAKIASALSHAHSMGMIHRDIKPANLILSRDGNIWVTDFGLAKLYDDESDLSRTGEVIGTPRYMAPEQILGAADERSDIYGVGLTLYELITRDCPWTNRGQKASKANQTKVSMKETLLGSRRKQVPLLEVPDIRSINPSVPAKLARVIMKACAHFPEARYQTAREFELDLNEICYRGRADRRNSQRSRATASSQQAKNIAVLIAVAFMLSVTTWVNDHRNSLTKQLPKAEVVNTPVSLPNCSVFEQPGTTDEFNVVTSVSSRLDDVEETNNGYIYIDSYDLELTWDDLYQLIGLRFAGVRIPKNVEILSANLGFYAARGDYIQTDLKIECIDDGNLGPFRMINYDLSSRPRVAGQIDWSPEEWKFQQYYSSPDFKELVQAVVDKPDWEEGHAVGVVISGKGIRVAWSYDGDIHRSPMLKIRYRLKKNQEQL